MSSTATQSPAPKKKAPKRKGPKKMRELSAAEANDLAGSYVLKGARCAKGQKRKILCIPVDAAKKMKVEAAPAEKPAAKKAPAKKKASKPKDQYDALKVAELRAMLKDAGHEGMLKYKSGDKKGKNKPVDELRKLARRMNLLA